jgi:hypothetical protein
MFRQNVLIFVVIAGVASSQAVCAAEPSGSSSVYGRTAEPVAIDSPAPSVLPDRLAAEVLDQEVPGSAVGDADAAARAERIVTACLAGLAREASISARMRQRVRVGDHSMVGAGRYLQVGLGEQQRFRFETSLAADSRSQIPATGSFFTVETLEICDGASFWTYRRWGDHPPEVHRVDVARVRQRVDTISHVSGPDAPAITQHIGGVPRIIAWLREWFFFVNAESAEIDGMPVWLVDGRWNADQASRMFPTIEGLVDSAGSVQPAALPDGVPWSVRLSIGKRELFPFRIEYFAVPGERPVNEPQLQTVGVFELYDVQLGEPVDQTEFIYSPASNTVIDTTEGHLGIVFGPRP